MLSQYIRFLYGVGIAGVRIPLPSCCVLRIQTAYPYALDPPNEEGFIEDSFVDGLKNHADSHEYLPVTG